MHTRIPLGYLMEISDVPRPRPPVAASELVVVMVDADPALELRVGIDDSLTLTVVNIERNTALAAAIDRLAGVVRSDYLWKMKPPTKSPEARPIRG